MNPELTRRNKAIARLHKKMTLKEIGVKYGISAERVRQILFKQGLSYDGSARQLATEKRSQQREADYQAMLDGNCKKIYGVTRQILTTLPRDKETFIRNAYCMTKKNATKQSVAFTITILDYWKVWKESRKFNQRGQHSNQYSCSRINFNKGYIPGNLMIEKSGDLMRRLVQRRELNRRKRK